MKKLFNVVMPWSRSGNASAEEGTYTTTVEAENEDHAKRLTAEEMADSSEKEFDGAEDRQAYIDAVASNWADVYQTSDQLEQDMASLFVDELFPDGCRRTINLEVLGQLLSANREALLVVTA